MASQQGITAGKLLLAGSGALLLWSGLTGKKWSAVLKDIIAGKSPLNAASTPITSNVAGIFPTPGGGNTTAPIGESAPGGYSNGQLRSLWILAGGNPSTAPVAACIAQHESSGSATVTSSNPDGGTNVGLWQLDTRGVGSGYSVAELQNPILNARVAVKGSANGTNWSDWATAGDCGAPT